MDRKIVSEFRDYLSARNYAEKTIASYTSCLVKFLDHFKEHPKNISKSQIYTFLAQFEKVNTKKQYVGAIRILYQHIYPQKNKVDKIKYPKSENHLPIILTPEEISRCLDTITNLKHRCIIEITWVCALRISEVQKLQIRHISRNNEIFIDNAKGAKDRPVPIPETTLELLREYFKKYLKGRIINGSEHLFEGQNSLYSQTSMRKIFDRAIKQARILKKVKFHSLRHSRATYWHDQGLSLRDIADLLGHTSTRTTEIYLHTSQETLKNKVLEIH